MELFVLLEETLMLALEFGELIGAFGDLLVQGAYLVGQHQIHFLQLVQLLREFLGSPKSN